jgi:SAM-dependent methyltransferase
MKPVFLFPILLWYGDSATYFLEKVSGDVVGQNKEPKIPGLHVGSMLAFKANCVNVDISGIEDGRGSKTEMGGLYALVADESAAALAESPLAESDPRVLYFLQHDGTKPFPFGGGSFDWIIAEHFIEHISFADAIKFLAEARRLLAPHGTLRISTPDLAIYAAAFFDPSQVIQFVH